MLSVAAVHRTTEVSSPKVSEYVVGPPSASACHASASLVRPATPPAASYTVVMDTKMPETPPRHHAFGATRRHAGDMAYDEQLAARIRDVVQGEPGLTEKRMFGGLAFLVCGNMAVSASGQGGMLLRVDPEQTEALVDGQRVRRFEMRGREMDGWLRVDPRGGRDRRGPQALGRARPRLRTVPAAQVARAQRRIGAVTAAVTATRSCGSSSTSSPRLPPDTNTVAKPSADSSRTVGCCRRWPIGEIPPTT